MTCRLLTALLMLSLIASAPAMGQSAPTVREIQVENFGAGKIEESSVLSYISVKVGDSMDRRDIARDVQSLLDTGHFSDVRVQAVPLVDGVRLTYLVAKKLRLKDPLIVEGNDAVGTKKIRELMGLVPGDPVDNRTLGTSAKKVIEYYRKKYYPHVEVDCDIEVADPEEGTGRARIRIQEGKRAAISRVTFKGNEALSAGALRRAMGIRSRWNPIRWFRKPRVDTGAFEVGRLTVRDLYMDRGYLDVEVDSPKVEPAGRKHGKLVVTVREGPRFEIAAVDVEGATLFPEGEVLAAARLKKGATASASGIEDAASSIRDFYGQKGYANTYVDYILDPVAGEHRVKVLFRITEGRLLKIRNVLIRGNTRTRDKVIRREILVYPGEVYDEPKVRRSERILSNLGYFSDVRHYALDTSDPGERDIVYEVEEQSTGRMMLGAGFSSIEEFMGYVELSQGNFDIANWPHPTGGGQKLKLRSQFGTKRKEYEISFIEPWFLNRRLSLGLDLYRTEVSYDDYDVERTGGAVTLGKALPGPNRVQVQYRLENTIINDVADTNEYVFPDRYADVPGETYFFDRQEDTIDSSLTVSLIHDTRNSPFFPKAGNRFSLYGSLTGGPMGFDTDIYELGLRTTSYWAPWLDHVISLRTRCDVVEAYGDTEEVPLADRLFIGGGRTVRGFDYRDIGPKVVREVTVQDGEEQRVVTRHRSIGGQSRAMASVEYAIPLGSVFRLAGFYDIGNAWRDAYDFDLSRTASGAGIGIRLDMPGFPIRIDRAWALEKDDELTDEDDWVIWVGYDY